MKTIDRLIAESTEFVCEKWVTSGLCWYAPVTRWNGMTWVHPTWAKEVSWEEITRRATRIWEVHGSLWNPSGCRIVWELLTPEALAEFETKRENNVIHYWNSGETKRAA